MATGLVSTLLYNVGRAAGSSRSFDYVVNIWMENQSCPSSLGSIGGSSTPYELSLATKYAYDNCHYSSITNPSLPNYMGFWAGQYPSCATSDSDPSGCPGGSAVNIADRLAAAGLTWKAFAENYPVVSGCSGNYQKSGSYFGGQYYARHFPPVYYTDITTNSTRCANLLNAGGSSGSGDSAFLATINQASGWPSFTWLTPNGCNDTHDCSAATGDTYLLTLVPQILSSTLFTTQNAALVITWDEGYPTDPGPIFAGPAVKLGYVSGSTTYNHYNWLATVLGDFGLSCIMNDCGKTQMTEFFGVSPPPALAASFSYSPISVAIGTSVTFTASVTGGSSPYRYAWSFGDGSSGTGNPVTHSYSVNGTYTVTLNVTDSASPSKTVPSTQLVRVGALPVGASSWSTVDWDPSFTTSVSQVCTSATANSAYLYWHPNIHGPSTSCAGISGGTLSTIENDTASTSWGSFDNAVVHEGNFPWQTDCGHVSAQPPNWACARNTYGLAAPAYSDFPLNMSASLTYVSSHCGSSCEYDTFIGIYWYFVNGPVTGNGCTQYYMEEQIRMTSFHGGALDPVGTTSTWCTFDLGYTKVVTQMQPGQSFALNNYDLRAFYQAGLSQWGLPSTTRAVLVGVEVGSEGYGAAISTGWQSVKIQTYEPSVVRADVNFDRVVDNSDLTLAQGLLGTCPSNFGTYQWRADANATNPCIDPYDIAWIEKYLGAGISAYPDFAISATTPAPVNTAQSATTTITITALDGFTGTVGLTDTVPNGLSCGNISNANNIVGSGSATVSCSATNANRYLLTITGTSGALIHSTTITFTVGTLVLPVLTVPSAQTAIQMSAITFTVTATDSSVPSPALTLSANQLPPGASFATVMGTSPVSGTFTWTPTTTNAPGTYTVSFAITDGVSSAQKHVVITLVSAPVLPILTVPGPQSTTIGSSLHFTVSANDPSGTNGPVVLSAIGLVSNMAFDPTSGAFSFTPSTSQAGKTFMVNFTATDTKAPAWTRTESVPIHVDSAASQPSGGGLCLSCFLPKGVTTLAWLLAMGAVIGIASSVALAYFRASLQLAAARRRLDSLGDERRPRRKSKVQRTPHRLSQSPHSRRFIDE